MCAFLSTYQRKAERWYVICAKATYSSNLTSSIFYLSAFNTLWTRSCTLKNTIGLFYQALPTIVLCWEISRLLFKIAEMRLHPKIPSSSVLYSKLSFCDSPSPFQSNQTIINTKLMKLYCSTTRMPRRPFNPRPKPETSHPRDRDWDEAEAETFLNVYFIASTQ